MKIIDCNKLEFDQIKLGNQIYKIFDNKYDFNFLEECQLKCNDEILSIQITSVNKYDNIDDVLNIINLEKFGKYQSIDEFKKYINDNYDVLNKKIMVCRIKNLNPDIIKIEDDKLLNLIDVNTLKNINLGLSGCQVYEVTTKTKENAILKIQSISGFDTLVEEFNVLKYLFGKVNVAKPIYYNNYNSKEYLLRECISGEPLYKYKNFGYKLGQELKKFHSLYNNNINFNKFEVNNLLNNILKNIDVVYELRSPKFSDYTKEELIKFIKNNIPENDALIHGDFSLTNILNNNDKYYFIDLGNMSISTKYFDIYVLKKSLIINNLENEFDEFLRGYGIDKLNENYLDWMSFVETSYN